MTKKPRDAAPHTRPVCTSTLGSTPGWDLDENAPADKRDPARPDESDVEQLRAELATIHEEIDSLSFRCHGATITIAGLSEIAKSLGLTLLFAATGAYAGKKRSDGLRLQPIIRTNQLLRSGELVEYLGQPLMSKIRLAIYEAINDTARTLLAERGIDVPDTVAHSTRRALREWTRTLHDAGINKDRPGAPKKRDSEDVLAQFERRVAERRALLRRRRSSVRGVNGDIRRDMADHLGWSEATLEKVLADARRRRRRRRNPEGI